MVKQIIKFETEWCGPCKRLAQVIKEIQFPSDVEYIVVDTDKDSKAALDHDIRSVPTLIKKKDGVIIDGLVGSHAKNEIQNWVNKW